jgi:hypothetical protein
METFTLSRKELHRPGLLKALGAGRISNGQAATALRLSVRQVQRLKVRFQLGWAALTLRQTAPESSTIDASLECCVVSKSRARVDDSQSLLSPPTYCFGWRRSIPTGRQM